MENCYFYMFILCKLYTRVFQFQYYIGKKYSDLQVYIFSVMLELPNIFY